MTPVWLTFWAVTLSLTWLVPNHFRPWTSFHAEAWMAFVGLIGAGVAAVRARAKLQWHTLSCLAALLMPLPWLQFAAGLLPFAGQAWISSAYLLGFLLALLVGGHWECVDPKTLEKALFLAFGAAAIVSVWLQFYTWLGLGEHKIGNMWSMGLSSDRPYANLGQPNNLATLLVWGLMACMWAYLKQHIGPVGAILMSLFIVSGVALTQSRAGLLELTVVLAAIWYWRNYWSSWRLAGTATTIYLYYLICPWLFDAIYRILLLSQERSPVDGLLRSPKRLEAWQMFIQATLERPWNGYGWTKVTTAQVAVADQFTPIGMKFGESHNLFLDLALWIGLPLGMMVSGFLLRWYLLRSKTVRHPEDAMLFLTLVAVGIHAMVELPLHYTYFLFPSGLIMGILDTRLAKQPRLHSSRWTLLAIWFMAATMFCITVRDYLLVESSYITLRFEQAHIGIDKTQPGTPPDVLALTQLRESIRASRFVPRKHMSKAELDWLANVTRSLPGTPFVYKLAKAYALNDSPAAASHWLTVNCRISDDELCSITHKAWMEEARTSPAMAAVQWTP